LQNLSEENKTKIVEKMKDEHGALFGTLTQGLIDNNLVVLDAFSLKEKTEFFADLADEIIALESEQSITSKLKNIVAVALPSMTSLRMGVAIAAGTIAAALMTVLPSYLATLGSTSLGLAAPGGRASVSYNRRQSFRV
jgi:hypothetical protein